MKRYLLNFLTFLTILFNIGGCSSKSGAATDNESTLTIDSTEQSEETFVANEAARSEEINLVVPIEMIDYGPSSSNSANVTFSRTATVINLDDFVAQSNSFSWEINAWNGQPSNSFDVLLVDESDTTIASISLPSAMSATTRYEVTFTPNSGNNIYKIKTPQNNSTNQIRIFSARILITQELATETKIYVPLTHG